MRLGLLTEFEPAPAPGWPTTVARMSEALRAQGAELQLFHPHAATPTGRRWLPRMRGRRAPGLAQEESIAAAAREADRHAHDCDFMLNVMGSRVIEGMQANAPFVHISDATWRLLRQEYPEQRNADPAWEQTERDVMRRASLLVFSSEWARRSAIDDYGCSPVDCHVIPLGANFLPDADRLGIAAPIRAEHECELLFVGRQWQRKRGDFALEVLRQLIDNGVDARLTLVGEAAPIPDDLTQRVDRLGWLEVQHREDAASYHEALERAHFLLLPSLADCTPIACAEASAFAVPTLASRVGGLEAMVLQDRNGRLFDRAAMPSRYVDAIRQLLSDPKQYADLRASSRRSFELRLCWEAWARDLLRVCCSVAR